VILTDVPLPLAIDQLTSWEELCTDAGPIETLAAKGIVPLDYPGMSKALCDWFPDHRSAMEWFRYNPSEKARLDAIREQATRYGIVERSELVGISNKNVPNENFHQLVAYRYRVDGKRQSNLVLVDDKLHLHPQAAIGRVLGQSVTRLERVVARE
jgi:hypothetical protein